MSTSTGEGFGGRLEPGRRPALVAIDMMRAYFDPASPLCLPSDAVLHATAELLNAARDRGCPVVHTRVAFRPDGTDGGVFVRKIPALRELFGAGPMADLMPEVAPRPGEIVLVKQYASAFFGTTLSSILTGWGCDTVILAGVTTSGCVRATAVDAIQHAYVPLVVADAVADRAPGPHEANLFDLRSKYAEVVSQETACSYLSQVRGER